MSAYDDLMSLVGEAVARREIVGRADELLAAADRVALDAEPETLLVVQAALAAGRRPSDLHARSCLEHAWAFARGQRRARARRAARRATRKAERSRNSVQQESMA